MFDIDFFAFFNFSNCLLIIIGIVAFIIAFFTWMLKGSKEAKYE
jgi:hypothetical protein